MFSPNKTFKPLPPRLGDYCRRNLWKIGGRASKCLSSGYDTTIVIMNSQYLWLPVMAHTKLDVNSQSWSREGPMVFYLSLLNYRLLMDSDGKGAFIFGSVSTGGPTEATG